jgi:hypothetical protein
LEGEADDLAEMYMFDFLAYAVSDGDIKKAKWIEENIDFEEAFLWYCIRAKANKVE